MFGAYERETLLLIKHLTTKRNCLYEGLNIPDIDKIAFL